jgi:hypothetical protein
MTRPTLQEVELATAIVRATATRIDVCAACLDQGATPGPEVWRLALGKQAADLERAAAGAASLARRLAERPEFK